MYCFGEMGGRRITNACIVCTFWRARTCVPDGRIVPGRRDAAGPAGADSTGQLWSMDFVSEHSILSTTSPANAWPSKSRRTCEVTTWLPRYDVFATDGRYRRAYRPSAKPAPGGRRGHNEPEFISMALDCFAYEQGVALDYSRPGKPTDTRSSSRSMAHYATNA